MNKKELKIYLETNHISKAFAEELAKKEKLRTSTQVYKRLEEERWDMWLIGSIVLEAERMKNVYFWESPRNAGDRRSYKKRHSWRGVSWEEGGDSYYAKISVRCTCKYIDVTKIFRKNGTSTNLTAIRNSYRRMAKKFYEDECYIPQRLVYKFEDF